MGEGHVAKFVRSVQVRLIVWIASLGILFAVLQGAMHTYLDINPLLISVILGVLWFSLAIGIGMLLGRSLTRPTEYIAQSILHISPSEHLVAAPNINELKFGRELADTLTRQVFDIVTAAHNNTPTANSVPAGLFDQLPVAILGLTENSVISLANSRAKSTIKIDALVGQQLNDTLHFLTEDEISIETWLQEASLNSLTNLHKWQKIAIKNKDDLSLGYFDVAVSFNKHSSTGIEAIIALYDHSEAYSEEESSISFVSMAVHELRTPLTILRGYIEAFKDELGTSATPQISDDLRKMNISAESLAAFVSNILNVAKINQGQLSLNLQEGDWNQVLPQVIDGLRVKASVYDKEIELRMQPGMPKAAIDRTTIGEVVTNLIDNAIKYSPETAKKIMVVSRLNRDGQIETSVQDHGVGIPSPVMPHLFTKFYRNHRNSSQIGGTGLGLFLSKAIVNAHNGSIWANSKENEGSTFGFTLIPFEQLAKDRQTDNNENIVRSSHGWIKNHSMQRR